MMGEGDSEIGRILGLRLAIVTESGGLGACDERRVRSRVAGALGPRDDR